MHRTAVILTAVLAGSAAFAQTPLDTAFSYQGRLTVGGGAPTGTYYFQFDVFDVPTGSAPVATTVFRDDVAVTNGLFTVSLDFGATFTGNKRWLEVSVRPGASTGAYTPLSPRQELTASPNALFSSAAATAAVAPWSGLSGVPPGFADGIDNDSGGTITAVNTAAGSGLLGGGTSGALNLSVNFSGTGTAASVARSDHTHARDSCSIYAGAGPNVQIPHAVQTLIPFDSETIDTNNLHSTVANTSRITIQQAGRYLVGQRLTILAGGGGYLRGFLLRNSGIAAFVGDEKMDNVGGGPFASVGTTGVFQLNAGDYLELVAYQTSGVTGSLAQGPDATTLWVEQQ